MKIEIVDMFGTQIEGTFFNDAALTFDEKLKENKVYLFSNGSVKAANKRFTSINNENCIHFEKNASIIEVEDDGSIALQAFDFLPISAIEASHLKTIDLIGVVTEINEKEVVKLRRGFDKYRRYLTIIDDTSCSIIITLWAEMCDRFLNIQKGDIIAIKGARVSEFGGKSINAADDHAILYHNINHDRAKKLLQFYQQFIAMNGEEALDKMKPLTQKSIKESNSGGGSGPVINNSVNYSNLS